MSWWQQLKAWLQTVGSLRIVHLPTVAAATLAAADGDSEYLAVLQEAYAQQVQPAEPAQKMGSFPTEAAVLILFGILEDQVNNGGFIQLIQNGYGPLLFDSPFAQDLTRWGAAPLAELTRQAAAIYHAHQPYLERPRALHEFSALYREFQLFEPLEEQFYALLDHQTGVVRAYVAQHLREFARVE